MDPLELRDLLWPRVRFYARQLDMIYSVVENRETYVVAANKMGKDFAAGFIVLYFFLTRRPVRVVTTSATAHHLDVLWGEINRLIDSSAIPLRVADGGPLLVNHHLLRKVVGGKVCGISYVRGMVANDASIEAIQGHHANPDTVEEANDGVPRTLFVVDEASSVMDEYHTMADSWAKRMFVFGNAWPCENFFRRAIRDGDRPNLDGVGYYRKVFRVPATDSPNVRLGIARAALGQPHTDELVIPGVKTYREYEDHRRDLNEIEQSVKLDATFWEGRETKLIPAAWLARAADLAERLATRRLPRKARAIGIDPAQGGDRTAMCAVDEHGVIEIVSRRTPDTNDVAVEAKAFLRYHGVDPSRVYFDAGGGGKQHADRLAAEGYPVKTVGFGESVALLPRTGIRLVPERIDHAAERYTYANRRSQLYGQLRQLLDPSLRWLDERLSAPPREWDGFAIPRRTPAEVELHRQLAPIPLTYDGEQRLRLIPKQKRSADSKEVTLTDLLGCSPDEADALALAVHALVGEESVMEAGLV